MNYEETKEINDILGRVTSLLLAIGMLESVEYKVHKRLIKVRESIGKVQMKIIEGMK